MRGERPVPSSSHTSPPQETGRSGSPLEEHKHWRLGKFSLDRPVLLKSRTTGKTGPIKSCGDGRRAKQIETECSGDNCCGAQPPNPHPRGKGTEGDNDFGFTRIQPSEIHLNGGRGSNTQQRFLKVTVNFHVLSLQ